MPSPLTLTTARLHHGCLILQLTRVSGLVPVGVMHTLQVQRSDALLLSPAEVGFLKFETFQIIPDRLIYPAQASIGRYSHQSECATVAWPSQGQEDCSACDPQEQDSFLGFLDNCFPAPSLQPVQHSSQAACQVDFNPLKRKIPESGEVGR
jgi:hypothetical protein